LIRLGAMGFIGEMHQASPVPPDQFATVLARLPPSLNLDVLARATKAIQRSRELRCGGDLLRLALAWLPGGMSLQETAAWADALGGAVRWSCRVLRIADGTSLSKPASRGTDWRIHVVFDLAQGRFSALEITDSHGGEALDHGVPIGTRSVS
jgi:hypothetical protein